MKDRVNKDDKKRGEEERKGVVGMEEREEVKDRKRGKTTGEGRVKNRKTMKETMVGYEK